MVVSSANDDGTYAAKLKGLDVVWPSVSRESIKEIHVRYLPENISGSRVLVACGLNQYTIDNSELQSDAVGPAYRYTPDLADKDAQHAAIFGTTVTGHLSNGWLKLS